MGDEKTPEEDRAAAQEVVDKAAARGNKLAKTIQKRMAREARRRNR